MKSRKTSAMLSFFILILGNLCVCQSQSTQQEPIDFKEMETSLKTAKVVLVEKNKIPGRTAPWQVSLDDGKTMSYAIFKHLNRRHPHVLADSYIYEIAAYELSKLLDIQIVPPVVEREVEGVKGSLQFFLVDCMKEEARRLKKIQPPDPESFRNTMDDIKVYDNLVHNEDCLAADDIFIHNKDWRVCRVDFSMAFPPTPELIPGCTIERCSKRLYKKLLELDDQEVRAKLSSYLNEEEIENLIKRKNAIIQTIKQLIEEKGEDAVLF